MIEFESEEIIEEGAPAWMATFADLMCLLMCFFVLLLSFSEMDIVKYKQIAGSLKQAFGVQSMIEAASIPKGTSVIAQEFSPGRPQPTPLLRINQQTTNNSEHSLARDQFDSANQESSELISQEAFREMLQEMLSNRQDEELLNSSLYDSVTQGKVQIERNLNQVIIRIQEHGSFASGAAELSEEIAPVIALVREALTTTSGKISVEGHTDDVPISSVNMESNWELSTARALSVARQLMLGDDISESRFVIVGYADTKPLRPNDSDENRAVNRRVEIVVKKEDVGVINQ